MASYAEIFKQQKNGVFKVKEIDVSEELPEIGKMYVKELNGFTKLSIIQSRQTDTEKMCLLICMSLCDKDGNSTESPDTFGDVIKKLVKSDNFIRLCARIAREIGKSIGEVMQLPQSEILIWQEIFFEEWEQQNPEKAKDMECERRRNEGVTESEALSDIAKFKALMNYRLKSRIYKNLLTVLKRWARRFRLLQPKFRKV